jgi:methyl-accepting chemotaxis protein
MIIAGEVLCFGGHRIDRMLGPLRRLIPDVIRRSYVLKFGITLLVLGLTVGAIGFLATDQIQTEVRQGVNEDLTSVADQEAEAFRNWHERNKLVTRYVANSESAQQGTSATMQGEINDLIDDPESTPDVQAIHFVDTSREKVLASSDDRVLITDANKTYDQGLENVSRPWATQIREEGIEPGETAIVGPYDIGDDETPRLAYVRTVENRPQRAIVYVVDVSQYQSGTGNNEGTVTYVLDVGTADEPNRRVLFDSSGEENLQDYPESYFGIVDNLRTGGDRPVRTLQPTGILATSVPDEYSDQDYVASYSRVEGTNFAVVVHTPRSEAYGFVDTVKSFGFLATLAGVLMIGLIGAILGRSTATAIDRLRKKSEEMEQGNLDVDFETERVDNIGRLYDGMANMRDALRRQITEAREAREEAELAREEAEQTSRHLQAKANEYRDVMQACAAGDLSKRMQPSQRNEAMGEIAQEFNAMIAELEQTVQQLKDFANEVATSSEEVTASAEEVRSASQQVTRSIQEISEGAERQNDSLQSVSREMSGLSTTVEEIASLSNEVADLAERTAKTGRRGREAAQEAIAGMNQIETESEEAVEQITDLEDEMNQIDELIEFITDVADQTNMLALNANIEAARSSDSGEGFAVVANEVKELAEETKEAAEDIEQRLERIQGQTEDTVDSVKTTGTRIAENTESVRNAVEALDEIAGYAQETNTGVQEISAATEEQAASTEEVVAMVDEAATISERTSSEAENVAAAAEEQTTAMTEVSDSASELSQQASRLSEALDRFSTEAEGEVVPSGDDATDVPPTDARDVEPEPEPEPEMDEVAGSDLPPGVEELADEFDDEAIDDDGETGDVGGSNETFQPPGETSASAPEPEPEPEGGDLPPGVEELAEEDIAVETDAAEVEAPGVDADATEETPPEPAAEDALEDLPGESESLDADFDSIPEEPGDEPEAHGGDAPTDDLEAPADDLEAPESEGNDADGEQEEPDDAPAGVGDLAGEDLAGDDLSLDDAAPGGDADDGGETLGGTEPATFGDLGDGDLPGGGDEDMFSFVDGEDDQAQSEENDD